MCWVSGPSRRWSESAWWGGNMLGSRAGPRGREEWAARGLVQGKGEGAGPDWAAGKERRPVREKRVGLE
jgi:hypothetical protein